MSWIKVSDNDGQNIIDESFRRVLFRIGHITVFESIRVVQYNKNDTTRFYYDRLIAYKECDHGILKLISNFYSKLLSPLVKKHIFALDIRQSKYLDKYPFLVDLFKDVVRDRKLEKLGICD